jgi:uncharacterized membrane protein YqjE
MIALPNNAFHCARVSTALLLVLVSALGCAHTAEEVAKKTASTTVEQTSEELAEPDNQRRLLEFLSSPAMQNAARGMAASFSDGLLDSLTQPERAERLAHVTQQYVAMIARSLQPEVVRMTGAAVDAGMQRAMSADNQRAAEQFVRAMTQAGGQAMAAAIVDDLGPAVERALAQDVGPGVTAMLDPNFKRAVAGASEQMVAASVVGAQRGLATDVPIGESHAGLLGWAQNFSSRAALLLQLAIVLAALGLLGLVGWILWLRAQTRREEALIRRRETSALLLFQALQASEGKPWAGDMREMVREALQDFTGTERPRHDPPRGDHGPSHAQSA